MSDSKKLALDLLSDLEAVGEKNGDLNDTQALTVALASVTLAINELRKAIVNIGKATDATAGFVADIAAHLVDDDGYDDEEDYDDKDGPYDPKRYFEFPQVKPFADFTNLRIA